MQTRDQINPADTWDLTPLFPSDEAWEAALGDWERRLAGFPPYAGKLHDAESLRACLDLEADLERLGERVGAYAMLKSSENAAVSRYQEMSAKATRVGSLMQHATSFMSPELLAMAEPDWRRLLADERLALYRLALERIARFRPHTLGRSEEELLALYAEVSGTAEQASYQLSTCDMAFEAVRDEKGRRVAMNFQRFMEMQHSRSRRVRRESFDSFYQGFEQHKNTFAALLDGSIRNDIFLAKARKFGSALDAALFSEQMPRAVYDNLVATINAHLPVLHRYYDVRRRKMKLDDLHMYDTYVPILAGIRKEHSWDEAVKVLAAALVPLGDEYVRVMTEGLGAGRWCDRYENEGKHHGAFSMGTFDAPPYILINYKPALIESLFTLAHEAGHSMHSWHSCREQPFLYYNYGIFTAEVASTFNERLLSGYLLSHAKTKRERAWLINHELDAMRGTIFRQTMFAEFEKIAHETVEAGQPLSVDGFRRLYRGLLDKYFGPHFVIDDALELECFRIPHFYRAFYVYKYATGMSAALALAERVLGGGENERCDYLAFLGGGCSRDPLDLLRGAGVDMASPEPIGAAMRRFGTLLDELETLL